MTRQEQALQVQAVGEPTPALIACIDKITFERTPPDALDMARSLVLDHIGVSLYGTTFEWSKIVASTIATQESKPESRIYAGGKASARDAAFINATAAHAIGLDEVHEESLSHPGCIVIPAALALGEAHDRSGAELLEAIIAGYEVTTRIGAAIGSALLRKGLHPPSHSGVFGATAAAGRILRLTQPQMSCAFGLAASMASGIMKFTQDPHGTMVKRIHAGMPAERGILAAQLASRGFTGPRNVLGDDYGYATILAEVADLSRISNNLGETFEIMNLSFKMYPCCKFFHTMIDAITECRAEPGFSAADVMTMQVFGPAAMFKGHMERLP